MPEIPRIYADSVEFIPSAYGLILKFKRRPPISGPAAPPPEDVAYIDMSWEHAKIMVFVLWRHIQEVERKLGVSFPVPSRVLSELRVGREDWDTLWK